LIPGSTGDAQRGQLGPEPGAVSRRPQWGQKGCSPLARPPQKGQEIASLWATVERAAARVPGTPRPPRRRLPPLPAPPEAAAPYGLWICSWFAAVYTELRAGSFARPQ